MPLWHVTVLSQWSPGEGTGLGPGERRPGWGGRACGVVLEEGAQVTRSKAHGGEVT